MKLTEGHYHEICDRSHVIACNIEEHLIHSYKGGDKFVTEKAKAALKLIHEIYCHAGVRF